MICGNCGSTIKEGAKFCEECGTPVTPQAAPVDASWQAQYAQGQQQQQPEQPGATQQPGVQPAQQQWQQPVQQSQQPGMQYMQQPAQQPAQQQWQQPAQQPTQQGAAQQWQQPQQAQQPYQQQQQWQQQTQQGAAQQPYQYQQQPPQQPVQPGTAAPSGKTPWYQSKVARIILIVAGVILVLVGLARIVGAFSPSSSGTSASKSAESSAVSTTASSAASSTASSSAASSAASSGSSKTTSVDPDSVDKYNCPTFYAVSELTGSQLQSLLKQEGFTWDSSNKKWSSSKGDCSLVVRDSRWSQATEEQIEKLGKGSSPGGVVYVISSKNYSNLSDAYAGLVSDVMVSEDAAANDSLLLGVAYGPSMTRFLIAIVPNTSSGEVICHAFTDDAIALGAFDKFANAESSNGGKSYGSTIDEVFKYYVGHAPGANH